MRPKRTTAAAVNFGLILKNSRRVRALCRITLKVTVYLRAALPLAPSLLARKDRLIVYETGKIRVLEPFRNSLVGGSETD